MLTHRGFSAWIVVNGEPIPEYLAAVDPVANRVSCWIPSEEGQVRCFSSIYVHLILHGGLKSWPSLTLLWQNFAVYWQDHGGKVDTCSFINLDGFVVPGRFLFGNGVSWREGVRTSTNSERPFVFGKVEETSTSMYPLLNAYMGLMRGNVAPEAMNQVISPKDIGTITLKIKQIDRVDSRPANPLLNVPSAVLGKRKAGDMCVGCVVLLLLAFEHPLIPWLEDMANRKRHTTSTLIRGPSRPMVTRGLNRRSQALLSPLCSDIDPKVCGLRSSSNFLPKYRHSRRISPDSGNNARRSNTGKTSPESGFRPPDRQCSRSTDNRT